MVMLGETPTEETAPVSSGFGWEEEWREEAAAALREARRAGAYPRRTASTEPSRADTARPARPPRVPPGG
jgi:hypothetical protein